MSRTVSLPLGPEHVGRRIDGVAAELAALLPEPLSRTRIKALIEERRAELDGSVVVDPSLKLPSATVLVLHLPPPADATPGPEALPLDVVYEDLDLLVLDKPPGLVVHPAAGHATGTLVNALLAHCGDSLSGIGGVRRPGIVHRLDKDTSGLMVVAKSDRAHAGLAATFADHGRSGSLIRAYLALVWGAPERAVGKVDAPLGRHPQHRERMAVVRADRGRHAVTHWQVEERFPDVTLLRCRLETGRTHQIRVHMSELGHPLVGDPVYGTGFRSKTRRLAPAAQNAVARLNRQALHATTLGFDHPVTGETLRFDSRLPGDLAAALESLREPSR